MPNLPNDNQEHMEENERKLIHAYKSVAATPEGQLMLQDLYDTFLWQDSRQHVAAGNEPGVTWIDGQRMLLRYINRKVTVDEEALLSAYRVPVELEQGDPLDAGQSRFRSASSFVL